MKIFQKPSEAILKTKQKLHDTGYKVVTEKWQGIDNTQNPMWETLNTSFSFVIPKTIQELREEVKPNLPWADDHFQERVGGEPINPGNEYKNWPFYVYKKENDKFRTENEKFSHSYMERIWTPALEGIRYEYGNFDKVLDLLQNEPFTRQAFLPIWFPEDTGATHGGRVPCTIGYHFIRRAEWFHVVYYIRSCDYLRHFRDDIYLAIRKLHWILDNLKERDPEKWGNVTPGTYTMHITSLHVFEAEKGVLKQSNK